jgi:Secretion system C-terminal sorting domain/Electron transfer DM13
MKKITFLAIIAFSSFFNLNAQCSKTASSFGNNTSVTMYNVLGTVDVVLNSPTSVSVSLGADFSTASGPDVRIFLVNRGNLTDAQLKTPMMFNARPKIEMGMNPAYLNTYTKTIPNGINISDFETVYFYCQQFNQFWDFGSFMPFTASNCASILVNDTFEKSDLKLFPNPVSNELNLENTENLKIKIYNIIGNVVLLEDSNDAISRKINVNNLTSGVYFIELTNQDNNRLVKRFIKQ